MADIGKDLLKFAVAFLTHQARKHLGDETLGIAAEIMIDIGGEKAQASLESLLVTRAGTAKLIVAAQKADDLFRDRCVDDGLRQALSLSLGDLPSVQKALSDLPVAPDETALKQTLEGDLKRDIPNLTDEQIQSGLATYLDCLHEALLPLTDFTLPIIGQAVLRNEQKVREIGAEVKQFKSLLEQSTTPVSVALGLFTIPLPVEDFAGRVAQLGELKTPMLGGVRIIAISGGGGVGKTELARKLANEIKDNYPDARINIDLLGMSEEPMPWQDAMRQILEPFFPAQQLPHNDQQLCGLYQETLANKKVLILLDNAANAPQVRLLVPPPPSATIVTSRQRFSLPEFGLQEPMRLPVLSKEDSAEFLQTACFRTRSESVEEIAQLSALCGYLPLALRVVACLLNDRGDWTVGTVISQLNDEKLRLKRLKRIDDAELDVEAAISLSYERLPQKAQHRFRTLGVFAYQFWQLPLARLWETGDDEDINSTLDLLVSRNLLTAYSVPYWEIPSGRRGVMNSYAMHDLTRIFAADRLRENGEEALTAIECHADAFLFIASLNDHEYEQGGDRAELALSSFRGIVPDLLLAWQRMQPSQANWPRSQHADEWLDYFPMRLGAVVDRAVPAAQRVTIYEAELARFQSRQEKGGQSVLGEPPDTEDLAPTEAVILNTLAGTYTSAGKPEKALDSLKKADAILQSYKYGSGRGAQFLKEKMMGNLGTALYHRNRLNEAVGYFQDQLVLARRLGDRYGESAALSGIAKVYLDQGAYPKALSYYRQELRLVRELGYGSGQADVLGCIADVFTARGQLGIAKNICELEINIARKFGASSEEGTGLARLGLCYANSGNFHRAIELYGRGLALISATTDLGLEAKILVNLGTAFGRIGQRKRALAAWRDALSIMDAIGHPYAQELRDGLVSWEKVSPNEVVQGLSPEGIVRTVMDGIRRDASTSGQHFQKMSRMASDPSLPPEVRETARVLQRILVGIKNPDLSHLPTDIAALVKSECDIDRPLASHS